jgi:hypothetical protein
MNKVPPFATVGSLANPIEVAIFPDTEGVGVTEGFGVTEGDGIDISAGID